MNLNELRYLVAVAQERSFRRAAERCFISQPALSLAIQKLEDELGVPLLERSKTEVTVTPIGERVIEQAQRALEEIGRIKDIARQGNDQLVGPLSLGVIYTVGPYLLPALIPVLRRRAPAMPLAVEENLTENLDARLRNGKLDVVLIALPFDVPGIITRPLYDEAFEVVLPAEHPWASRSSIKPKELSKERVLLLNAGHCFSNQVAEACPELAARGGQIQQGNSLETIRNMVASGLGITVLPCSANMVKFRSPLLKAIPFATPLPSRRIALAWRRSFFRGEAVEALAQAIRSLNTRCLSMLPER